MYPIGSHGYLKEPRAKLIPNFNGIVFIKEILNESLAKETHNTKTVIVLPSPSCRYKQTYIMLLHNKKLLLYTLHEECPNQTKTNILFF